MSDQIPVHRLIERPDGSVELSDSDREKLSRIEWLHVDNAADAHPSFERLAAAETLRRINPATRRERPRLTDLEALRAHRLYSSRLRELLGETL